MKLLKFNSFSLPFTTVFGIPTVSFPHEYPVMELVSLPVWVNIFNTQKPLLDILLNRGIAQSLSGKVEENA